MNADRNHCHDIVPSAAAAAAQENIFAAALHRRASAFIIVLLIVFSSLAPAAPMTDFDVHTFLKAVAQREGATFVWNARGEYGPHQLTLGITRDWAKVVKRIAFLDEAAARDFAIEHYHEIVYWHAERLLYNHKLRARCQTRRELVMILARAWKYGVRVERLQDISEADAISEGIDYYKHLGSAHYQYGRLWDFINAKRAPWDSNPWVWVLTFKRLTP